MLHPIRINAGDAAAYGVNVEKTGVSLKHARVELLKEPSRGCYWLSQYKEQGMGQWDELSSMDLQTGDAIILYPEMIAHYLKTGVWTKPSTNSLEHPARLNTKVYGSLGAELFSRLESVGIEDHGRHAQVLKDPLSNRYWLAVEAIEKIERCIELTSLADDTSQAIVEHPKMLAHYLQTGEWVTPYAVA